MVSPHHSKAFCTANSCSASSINGKRCYSLRSSHAEPDIAKCDELENRDDLKPGHEESSSDGISSSAHLDINHSRGSGQVEAKSSSSRKDGEDADSAPADPNPHASANSVAEINAVPGDAACAQPGKMRMRRKKFLGVRQRPSGRWVAEIKDTTQKIRMWLGTFDTAEEAARAYDEAACLLRGSNTRTNFLPSPSSSSPSSSPLASRLAHMLRSRRSQSSAPASPEPPLPITATVQPNHSNPSIVASSHINPLMPPPFRGSNQALQGNRHFPNRFLNHPFSGPTVKHSSHHHHLNHKHQQSLQNFSHRKTLLNQGYSLQHLRAQAEAQHRFVGSWHSGSSKPQQSPPWRPYSKLESESSDSDPSSPQAEFLMEFMPRIDDDCQVTMMHDKDGFNNIRACEHPTFDCIGRNLPGGTLSSTNLHGAAQEMDMDDHSQIFARDKLLINAEDIDDLTHDEHLMKSSHYHHTYRGSGSFMNALLGLNDDIILDPSEPMHCIAPSYDHDNSSPFADFNVDSSLGSGFMHVDDFPLISELSGKLEEAESSLNYAIKCNKDASNHTTSSSSSNSMGNNCHDDEKLGLNPSANTELEMKRLQFERRASASLYALNGVHEMLMKQNPTFKSGTNTVLAGNVTAISSFNFLSASPSYIHSSSWKSAPGSSMLMCNDDEASAVRDNGVSTGAFMSGPLSMPSSSSSPTDNNMASNNSTLPFSDTTNGMTVSNISSNNSDAQSQQEAAMWNSWDLAPLCTLVA